MSLKRLLLILLAFNSSQVFSQHETDLGNLNKIIKAVPVNFDSLGKDYLETVWIVLKIKDSSIIETRNSYVDDSRISMSARLYLKQKLLGFKFTSNFYQTIIIPFLIGSISNRNIDKAIAEEKFFENLKKNINGGIYVHPIFMTVGIVSPPKKARQTAAQPN